MRENAAACSGLFILVSPGACLIDIILFLQDCYNSWRTANEVRI
jgi:hypothetical protein